MQHLAKAAAAIAVILAASTWSASGSNDALDPKAVLAAIEAEQAEAEAALLRADARRSRALELAAERGATSESEPALSVLMALRAGNLVGAAQ